MLPGAMETGEKSSDLLQKYRKTREAGNITADFLQRNP